MKSKYVKTNVPELSPEAPFLYEGENTLYDVVEAGVVQSLNHLLNNKQNISCQACLIFLEEMDVAKCFLLAVNPLEGVDWGYRVSVKGRMFLLRSRWVLMAVK